MSNVGAQALYHEFGFVPAGIRKNYYAEVNEDALVMWAHDIDTDDLPPTPRRDRRPPAPPRPPGSVATRLRAERRPARATSRDGAAACVLGIETSCDETAAAVVDGGRSVVTSVVSSQVDLHARYGGVVPELAGRAHVELALPVVTDALAGAGPRPPRPQPRRPATARSASTPWRRRSARGSSGPSSSGSAPPRRSPSPGACPSSG